MKSLNFEEKIMESSVFCFSSPGFYNSLSSSFLGSYSLMDIIQASFFNEKKS